MRLTLLAASLILSLGCTGPKKATMNPAKLNGSWVPVQQEIGGKALPKTVYDNERLVIADSNYVLTAESTDKGVVRCKDNKMDIYGREGVNAGKHFTAIYKLEGGQLTICYNLRGDSYPTSFVTDAQPALFLSVYKKE